MTAIDPAHVGSLAPGRDSGSRFLRGLGLEVWHWTELALAQLSAVGPREEDYRVYDAALEAQFRPKATWSDVTLITEWPERARPVPATAGGCLGQEGLSSDLVNSFSDRNRFRWDLAARGETAGRVRSLVFSRVGYDHTGERALVFVDQDCGLCGGGHYLLLRRGGDGWSIETMCTMWER